MIELADLSREFGLGARRVRTLKEVSLVVETGEVIGVLGENGAGKTTLLRILSSLLTPSSGQARVGGWCVAREPRRVRELLTVIFGGDRGLYSRLTGRQNLEFFGVLRGLSGPTLRRRIAQAVEQVGLGQAADRQVETYSRGMRQRLHLAAGLSLVRAPVVLLDEPTVGLDPMEAQRVRELVAALRPEGTTVVMTSHLLHDIETLCDRVVMLREGSLTHDMTMAEFMGQSDQVATVNITCQRDPAGLDLNGIGRLVSVKPEGRRWALRLGVRAWDAAAFAALSALMRDYDVVSVNVDSTSLEDVYRVLASQEVDA